MNDPATEHPSHLPPTAAVQQWVDAQVKTEGLVDIKFSRRPSADSTAESFSGEVLAMLSAAPVSGVSLD